MKFLLDETNFHTFFYNQFVVIFIHPFNFSIIGHFQLRNSHFLHFLPIHIFPIGNPNATCPKPILVNILYGNKTKLEKRILVKNSSSIFFMRIISRENYFWNGRHCPVRHRLASEIIFGGILASGYL